uniref:Jumonji domain-containing protein 4 n=1 Tax=Schistosoma haematobium TaxID=6185 RepID=A0A095C1H8_SCHHA
MSLFDDLPEPSVESNDLQLTPYLCSVVARKGERPEMQDSHIVVDNLVELMYRGVSNEIARVCYFAIFDGHGGAKAANFACKRLHQHIAMRFPRGGMQQVEKDIKRVLYDSYKKTDEEFLREACQQRPHWRDGSTSATILLVNNTLYIANLGDSKVVLARLVESPSKSNNVDVNSSNTLSNPKLNAICLTKDHNPMDYEERQRIQATGASVQNGRVNNVLEVSRSFGDYQFKKQGVTCIPDVKKCQLTDNDQFLLIACDGLWKSFPPNEAVHLTHELLMQEIEKYENEHRESLNGQCTDYSQILCQRHLDSVCTHLVSEAVLRMSGDNVTCILLVFPTMFVKKHHSTDLPGHPSISQEEDSLEPRSKLPRIENYLLKNQLCIFDSWITKNWPACFSWRSPDGLIDLKKIFENVPDEKLCVSDCSVIEFNTHPVREVTVEEFISYWTGKAQGKDDRILYLKDWHYFKKSSENSWFTLPEYFSSDWLNEFWSLRNDLSDDFKFLYLGSHGTWTPLHADVYRSFSWSANILGHKRWWIFPPGEERKLLSSNGQIPFDIRSIIKDRTDVKYYLVDQYSGQVVFVPSGWYHQVVNMTDCISINHNWFNATNVSHVWDHLQDQLKAVEVSTKDVSSIPGWHEECQTCLRAYAGINFEEFFSMLKYILITRWSRSSSNDDDGVSSFLKKCKSMQYTSLDVLNNAMDYELTSLIETNLEIFQTALKNPLLWRKYYTTDVKTSTWIRMHDFCMVIQIIKEFVHHETVNTLHLCNGVLQSFWSGL